MKAVAPTTFARMSESLMSRKPLHKRLSRGFATRRSLPPIVEKNWRQKLPGGSPQGCEMPVMQRLGLRELGGPQTGFQTPPVPQGQLLLQAAQQERTGCDALLQRLPGQLPVGGPHSRQLQLLAPQVDQLFQHGGVGVHAPTPSNASYRRGSPTGTAGPRGSRTDASRRPSSRLSSNWRMPSAWQVPAASASWIASWTRSGSNSRWSSRTCTISRYPLGSCSMSRRRKVW